MKVIFEMELEYSHEPHGEHGIRNFVESLRAKSETMIQAGMFENKAAGGLMKYQAGVKIPHLMEGVQKKATAQDTDSSDNIRTYTYDQMWLAFEKGFHTTPDACPQCQFEHWIANQIPHQEE